MNVAGKRVVVLGLAREGEALARFLAERGADVTVTDRAPEARLAARLARLPAGVRAVVGADHPELLSDADAFFVSPGVPESNAVYAAAVERGLAVQSMTTLFFELCRGRVIGVTGSSGKTTTTGLIGHILQTAGRDVAVGGNIGAPMLDLLPAIGPTTAVVLELSSFQLGLLNRSPNVAVVTNISPNHLDRHGSMAEYVAAKRRIVEHQRKADYAVLNACDPEVMAFAGSTPAHIHWFNAPRDSRSAVAERGSVGLREGQQFSPVMPIDDIPLLGQHNVENVLAALSTADIEGVEASQMAEAVAGYRPPPHRLQTVGQRDGIRYVDDSIATSPARVLVALRAIEEPVVLIAGGRDKKLPWDDFASLVAERASGLVLIGEASSVIEEAVRRAMASADGALVATNLRRCGSLADAVEEATSMARPGDVVLLSPGCTSYDMFNDFEERGLAFMQAVEALDAA